MLYKDYDSPSQIYKQFIFFINLIYFSDFLRTNYTNAYSTKTLHLLMFDLPNPNLQTETFYLF